MVKRIFDILVLLLFFPILLPFFILAFFLVKWKLSSPVLFRQKRVGHQGKIFEMFKFRSMTNQKDEKGDLLPDSLRLTKFGKILRSTSLDELPGLLNVLKGEMSLVGPRPLLVEYLPYYSYEQRKRHCVRPGITGWAQINGRNELNWPEKLALDVWYVQNQSFCLDFKILLKTVQKVFKREGISPKGMEITPRFDNYVQSSWKKIAIISNLKGNKIVLEKLFKEILKNPLKTADVVIFLGDIFGLLEPKELEIFWDMLLKLNKEKLCLFVNSQKNIFCESSSFLFNFHKIDFLKTQTLFLGDKNLFKEKELKKEKDNFCSIFSEIKNERVEQEESSYEHSDFWMFVNLKLERFFLMNTKKDYYKIMLNEGEK